MNKHIKHIVLFVVAAALFGVVNLMIYKKEMTLQSGTLMLLELAPVDPRSLMQGDYMALRYKIAQAIDEGSLPKDGALMVSVDDKSVATFKRLHVSGVPLAPGERLLRYRIRANGVRLGAESFFFQEGHAMYYNGAKYGELRVADSGDSVLVGLRGQDRERLGPPDKARTPDKEAMP
jgi:uncharacterized membrane-anchored protein